MLYLHYQALTELTKGDNATCPIALRKAMNVYRQSLLQRFCLIHQLAMPIYDKTIYGKPFVKNSCLQFNQSHSAFHYVLICSLIIKNIGVDIEHMSRLANFEALAKRCFHRDEYKLWHHYHNHLLLWFRIWTIKEAVLKASGLGIRLNLNELNIIFMGDVLRDDAWITHPDIGQFYCQSFVKNNCMISLAYPFEYQKVAIIEY